jgi:hypothetical protein
MENYRVYVGAIQNLDKKIKYSCCDPAMARMLVFDCQKPLGDFRIMKQREQETLSTKERTWLSNTRLAVAFDDASQSAIELSKNLNHLMDALEEELRKEKEAMTDHVKQEEADGSIAANE